MSLENVFEAIDNSKHFLLAETDDRKFASDLADAANYLESHRAEIEAAPQTAADLKRLTEKVNKLLNDLNDFVITDPLLAVGEPASGAPQEFMAASAFRAPKQFPLSDASAQPTITFTTLPQGLAKFIAADLNERMLEALKVIAEMDGLTLGGPDSNHHLGPNAPCLHEEGAAKAFTQAATIASAAIAEAESLKEQAAEADDISPV